jgi:arylsulfatase
VDGKVVSTEKTERSVPFILPVDPPFSIGNCDPTPVDNHDYQAPFPFTGKINQLTISVERPKLTPEDIQKLKQMEDGAGTAQ